MSSYKLIAVDVDGTLLRSNGTVSDRTKQALSTAIERGHHLAVATGRRRRTARLVLEQLDLPYFLVASQGAAVWNDDDILFHSHLPVPAAHGVLRILQEHDMAAAILGNALQEDVIWVAGDWQANRRLSAYLSRNLQYVRPLENGALEHDPLELIVMDTMERLEQLNEALTGHPPPPPSPDAPAQPGPDECLPLWRVIFSRNQFTAGGAIEIVGPTTSKASALSFLCGHLAIEPPQVIAFGDNVNDVEMLDFAGLGVAMGNATDDARAAADHIAPTNDEDGIAAVLEDLGLA